MKKTQLFVLVSLTLLAPLAMQAQNQMLTAHFGIVREGGKSKAKDLSNVVAWLVPVVRVTSTPPVPNRGLRLVQKNKAFSPHLLVVPVGSVVEFPNRDPFFHNVFSLFEGKRFDLGLYEAGGSRLVHFDRPGISYVFCNIHPEMSAVIVVLDTPYYGVSDAAGDVRIPEVPPGSYVLHVWSETASPEQLQALTRHVTISDSTHTLGTMWLTESRTLHVSHNNKYDQPYESPAPSSPVYVQR